MILRRFHMDTRQQRAMAKVKALYPGEDEDDLRERVLYPSQRALYNLWRAFLFVLSFPLVITFIWLLFAV